MHVTIVNIHVKPEHVDEFIKASLANSQSSSKEPGNKRFDLLQSADDPTRFVLYEAYESPEHAAAHKETAHYKAWAEAVKDWFVEPRSRASYKGLSQ